MRHIFPILTFCAFQMLYPPSLLLAIETAPRLTDREVVERLIRLEEGQLRLETLIRANADGIKQLRDDNQHLHNDMNMQNQHLRNDMNTQNQQLRNDINSQFDRLTNIMLGIVGAFAAIVTVTISFAIWDRRTMLQPFETKIKIIEEDLSQNRKRLHSFIEAMRSLSQSDSKVAEVLRRFNLL